VITVNFVANLRTN